MVARRPSRLAQRFRTAARRLRAVLKIGQAACRSAPSLCVAGLQLSERTLGRLKNVLPRRAFLAAYSSAYNDTMARTPRWTEAPIDSGVRTVRLSSWKYFHDYITQRMLDLRQFIWRGQESASWLLEPTLDRILRKQRRIRSIKAREDHLRLFKFSSRGRRGPAPAALQNDNDWWALGQHYGLATPLLDWTTSPYVAAYFAFVREDNEGASRRAVWGLSRLSIRSGSQKVLDKWTNANARAPVIELVEPLSDENSRLVSQGGLFTRSPDGNDVEEWVRDNFDGDDSFPRLIKITIPNADRELALRSLNRMNINHLSLFPDLYGASKFTNLDLLIDKY